MQAEIISIGDELTSGQRLDTNSQWLSQRLGELGVRVAFHTTVADDLPANIEVLRLAAERADLVIATGGLGPTADDLTREALAAMLGVELVENAAALAHIEGLFARRRRPMPERNRVQALFPAGGRVIANPEGTAPGIDLDVPRAGRAAARIFALPGVPAEMRQMWEVTVGPAIAELTGGRRVIRHRRIKCFGVGESDLEQKLPDLIRRGRVPQVGITVHEATITLRITAEAATADEAIRAMDPTVVTIHECLGDLVFGQEDEELEHAVARLLRDRGQTLATAEWGTGGLIADWLGDLGDAAGGCFLGAVVGSAPSALAGLLQIDAHVLRQTDAMQKLVEAMAVAARERTAADYGLAVGPFPVPVLPDEKIAEFHYAVASPDGVRVRSSPLSGHSAIIKSRSAKQALNLLRLTLLHRAPGLGVDSRS